MKRRIAVVEDNPDNRLLLQVLLSDLYEVTEHVDGYEAVAQIPLTPPDLVLLDVSLPGLDGPGVLKQLRAHAAMASVPIIALTAHAMTGDRERFLAAGFDDYVSKPIVDEQLLFEAIARQISNP